MAFYHRRGEWRDRITGNRAVRYDIAYDPDRNRWYLDASWGIEPSPSVPLITIRTARVLGVDLNDGHLATCVVDPCGNPIGRPATIALAGQCCSASQRDGHLRAALTALLDRAEHAGCGAIVIENLDFADARTSGRDTMGRGKRGRRFRRTVASIPTGKFRDRLRAMASRRGVAVVAVDPAYTSSLLGYPLVALRQRAGNPPAPRYLNVAHVGAILQGALVLGLVWAARLSDLSSGWNITAAWLVVASGVLIAAKDTINWLTGVEDEFTEKARTAPFGVAGAVALTVGLIIFIVGDLAAL
ncbi:hypothetical protein [Nocardia tengchongensis]|uniref:hypothetical protein n=1 Tax=Nocardia tengchongensis TaxID=2055889 RepID=UPI00365F88C7